MNPSFEFAAIGSHEMHVTTWGNVANPAIVMWHGLARTGRDFDEIAQALSNTFFVLCPDTIGRGLSSWSLNPDVDYCIKNYAGMAVQMLDHFGIKQAGWLGTSMGGQIGMRVASGKNSQRLKWLIVNDIGPEVPQTAIDRITSYASMSPTFSSLNEAEIWLRAAYKPFGPASDTFWRRMTRNSVRRRNNGKLTTHFDPRIMAQFSTSKHELNSWDRYERIDLPMHVTRGAFSDLLTPEIAARMQSLGPRPKLTEFWDCGHAPTLSRNCDINILNEIISELNAQTA